MEGKEIKRCLLASLLYIYIFDHYHNWLSI